MPAFPIPEGLPHHPQISRGQTPRLECHPGLPRWVHRNLPPLRCAAHEGRSASGRVPPMDYLDNPDRRRAARPSDDASANSYGFGAASTPPACRTVTFMRFAPAPARAEQDIATCRPTYVELFGAIFADHVQRAPTARTFLAFDVDDDLVARQMCRQRAAIPFAGWVRRRRSGGSSRPWPLRLPRPLAPHPPGQAAADPDRASRNAGQIDGRRRCTSCHSFSFSACSSGTTSRSMRCRISVSSGSAARSICTSE